MIGILLVLLTIAFFCAWNFIYKGKRLVIVIISLLLVCTLGFIVANFHDHYGMHSQTRVSLQRIKPTKSNILVYTPLGSHKAYKMIIYKNNKNSLKKTPINIHNHNVIKRVKRNKGYLLIEHRTWGYNNVLPELCFSLMQPQSYKASTRIFYIPKQWNVLSVKQAQHMKQIIKNKAKALKKQGNTPQTKLMLKQKIQAQIQQQAVNNPKILQSPKLQKKITNKLIKQQKKQMKEKLLNEAIQQAKTTPVGYKA